MIDAPRFTAQVVLEDADGFINITAELSPYDEVPYRIGMGYGKDEVAVWMSDKDLASLKKGLAELQRRRKAG